MQVSRPETSLKRDSSTESHILLWILHNFSKKLIYRTPPDDSPADSFFPTKVLSIHQFFCFFLRFFSFIIDNCNCESLFRKGIRMKIFLLFTIIYPKINMNVADEFESAIICRLTLEIIQISLGKSLGNCPLPRRILKAAVHIGIATSHKIFIPCLSTSSLLCVQRFFS